MNIKVTADSTCDLSEALLRENDIEIFPLSVTKNDKAFFDCVDIFPTDIVNHVANGGSLCSTSAVNVGSYAERFAVLSKEYDAVIHISLGSGFSSSYQNACIAAADYPNIRVIDSCNLSSGQGHVVMEACRLRKEMDDLDAITAELNDVTGRVEASFLLDRLDYMVKGGRCSMVAALGANLLQLKPCIEVIDGKMKVVKKYRGNYAKCLETYIKERIQDRDDLIGNRAFITYSPTQEELVQRSVAAAKSCGSFEEIVQTNAGCTITCHCGPNCLGILYIRKKTNG